MTIMLYGQNAVLQAPMFDALFCDPFALADGDFGPAKVVVGGRYVVQGLVVAMMIEMFDEGLDLGFDIPG